MMLSVNQQDINLGKLKFGVAHKFKYVLTNSGNNVLRISRITVGCDKCTTTACKATTLKPGENADLDVVFIPGSTGSNLKSISVIYDDKELKLKFRAQVE